MEWKSRRIRHIDNQAGVEPEQGDPAFDNLCRNAGSSTFEFKEVDNLSRHEEELLLNKLAPVESDGAGDQKEWSLFKEYLSGDEEGETLDGTHSLSKILMIWRFDKVRTWSREVPEHP